MVISSPSRAARLNGSAAAEISLRTRAHACSVARRAAAALGPDTKADRLKDQVKKLLPRRQPDDGKDASVAKFLKTKFLKIALGLTAVIAVAGPAGAPAGPAHASPGG